jgi:hypothetical protein
MQRTVAFLSLFTSVGTLLCCALPALFVLLGFGAAFAGLVGTFPQLIWISEHKIWIFATGAVLLLAGGALQWKARTMACPIDANLGAACRTTRDWSVWIYGSAVILYLIGASFAFLPIF